MPIPASSTAIETVFSGIGTTGPVGGKRGTEWSATSPSVTTSRRVELTSEQDPEKEQDLDLGKMEVEESGFVDRLSSFEEGTGEDDGVDVVAIRVGVLDIT